MHVARHTSHFTRHTSHHTPHNTPHLPLLSHATQSFSGSSAMSRSGCFNTNAASSRRSCTAASTTHARARANTHTHARKHTRCPYHPHPPPPPAPPTCRPLDHTTASGTDRSRPLADVQHAQLMQLRSRHLHPCPSACVRRAAKLQKGYKASRGTPKEWRAYCYKKAEGEGAAAPSGWSSRFFL